MIKIDGSSKSGSGTILRYAVALSALLSEELHITNIRANRDKPGLRAQHLASVRACAQLCEADIEGANINSRELYFKPNRRARGGRYQFEIGSAGSTTLLAQTLLPIALFADSESIMQISGGLFQDFAPSAHYMQYILLPTLERMGVKVRMEIIRPGYTPRGGGMMELKISPVQDGIKGMTLLERGIVQSISGIALSSHLKERRVSHRMVEKCNNSLLKQGYKANIDITYDEKASSAGANLAIWAKTDTGCLLGSDQAGRRGRSSEEIGKNVARNLIEDLGTSATVDRYLADQLIIYAALANGGTEYIIPFLTEHVDTNLWLIKMFDAKVNLKEDNSLRVEGIAYTASI